MFVSVMSNFLSCTGAIVSAELLIYSEKNFSVLVLYCSKNNTCTRYVKGGGGGQSISAEIGVGGGKGWKRSGEGLKPNKSSVQFQKIFFHRA